MEKRNRNILIVSIIALILILGGVSYAYFYSRINGLESASTISLTAGRMNIIYSEGDENITASKMKPREEAWITKTFTITGSNDTDLRIFYSLGLDVITNTFGYYLSYDLNLLESSGGSPAANVSNKAIVNTGYKKVGVGSFGNATEIKHKYELKIYFKDNGDDQSMAMNSVFNAKIVVKEERIEDPSAIKATFLKGSDVNIKMKNLANIANGDNTVISSATKNNTTITAIKRSNVKADGLTSNNIVSTANSDTEIYMWYDNGIIYYYTDADEIYTDSNMVTMFAFLRNLTDISGLEDINTINATNMNGVFVFDTSLADISPLINWNVSNVTDFGSSFQNTLLTSLTGLENWDTSKVTNMMAIFYNSTELSDISALSNWDTSSATIIANAFQVTKITNIDALSNWDTSKVTTIDHIFSMAQSLNSIEGARYWNVSNIKVFDGSFYGTSALTDASPINDWDIRAGNGQSFNLMFGESATHPNFTKIYGTWLSAGSFSPQYYLK